MGLLKMTLFIAAMPLLAFVAWRFVQSELSRYPEQPGDTEVLKRARIWFLVAFAAASLGMVLAVTNSQVMTVGAYDLLSVFFVGLFIFLGNIGLVVLRRIEPKSDRQRRP